MQKLTVNAYNQKIFTGQTTNLVAEMHADRKKVLVVGVYIPPYRNQESLELLAEIESYFENTLLPEAQYYDMLVIGGDLNATHINWDPNGHTNAYRTSLPAMA